MSKIETLEDHQQCTKKKKELIPLILIHCASQANLVISLIGP